MLYLFAYIDETTGKAVEKSFSSAAALTLREAVQTFLPQFSSKDLAVNNVPADSDSVPEEGDRIDILSPVRIDPKKARELRVALKAQSRAASFARHGGKHQLSEEKPS